MDVEVTDIEISKLHELEDNPRRINKADYENLKKSIKNFPEMRQLREIVVDENYTVLGGNMRLKAMRDLGIDKVPVKIVRGLSEDKKREFIIKDNISNGEFDMDILANQWDADQLLDWGMFDVKKGIKDEKEIEKNPPAIIASFLTFDYDEEIRIEVKDETAIKLMEEMVKYREENGSYKGFWDEHFEQ